MGRLESKGHVSAKIRSSLFVLVNLFGTLVFSAAAHATNINVTVTGASQSGQCSLTDAVQAATTNKAVKGCAAGSATATDTIQLKAKTTYQAYGKYLNVPTAGGALIIAGGSSGTVIRSPDYGAPPSPIINYCFTSAAIVSGGTLTLKNLTLRSSVTTTSGVCVYSGSLTVDHAGVENFGQGGIFSYPSATGNHRVIKVINGSDVNGNSSPNQGAGIAVNGKIDLTIADSQVNSNTSGFYGGGIWWWQFDGAGSLTITGTQLMYNTASDSGGGVYLSGADAASSVTFGTGNMIESNVTENGAGGAIYIDDEENVAPVIISGTYIRDNTAYQDSQQNSLNAELSTRRVTQCRNGSDIDYLVGSLWPSPPLSGDNTCLYP